MLLINQKTSQNFVRRLFFTGVIAVSATAILISSLKGGDISALPTTQRANQGRAKLKEKNPWILKLNTGDLGPASSCLGLFANWGNNAFLTNFIGRVLKSKEVKQL